MDPELKELLELSKENNKLLKKLWHNVKLGRFFRFFYWVLIIAITLGSYYYIQPYVDKLIKIYTGNKKSTLDLTHLPEVELINQFLNKQKDPKQ